MKKSTFTLIIILLISMIITVIGYNELVIRHNSQRYQELKNQTVSKEPTSVKQITINCIGDSLTLGDKSNSYPTILSSSTPFSINKFGGTFDQTIDLSIRLGRTKIYVKDITIPENPSPIKVKIYNQNGEILDVLKNTGNNFYAVEIAGITGKLKYNSSMQSHTFTRDQQGKEKNITSLTQITAQYPQYHMNDIAIIFTGTYDPNVENGVFKTITYQRAIINQLKTKKYIVISLTSKRKFPIVDDMNKVLKEEHGEHFLDFRLYLLENGLKDAHITPTVQDKKDLSKGLIPSSLLKEDKINGNAKFNHLLAEQIINKMIALEYIDKQQLQ